MLIKHNENQKRNNFCKTLLLSSHGLTLLAKLLFFSFEQVMTVPRICSKMLKMFANLIKNKCYFWLCAEVKIVLNNPIQFYWKWYVDSGFLLMNDLKLLPFSPKTWTSNTKIFYFFKKLIYRHNAVFILYLA